MSARICLYIHYVEFLYLSPIETTTLCPENKMLAPYAVKCKKAGVFIILLVAKPVTFH